MTAQGTSLALNSVGGMLMPIFMCKSPDFSSGEEEEEILSR